MSDRRFLILHAGDDLSELQELEVHLAPLSRLGGLDLVAAAELEGASDEALGELLADSRALLLCLSAPLLALDPVLDDRLRGLVRSGRIEVLLLRPCAHRLVPWLAASETVPRDGRLLAELERGERDLELSHLAYRLAQELDVVADAGLEDSEVRDAAAAKPMSPAIETSKPANKTSTPEARKEEPTPEPIPAAGPAPKAAIDQDSDDLDCLEDEACQQFEETCADILPSGQVVGDEAIEALVELAIVLGTAREEIGDESGAALTYRYAVRRLVEVIATGTKGKAKASRYSRVTRLALNQALTEVSEGKPALDTLRQALERALERAARQKD